MKTNFCRTWESCGVIEVVVEVSLCQDNRLTGDPQNWYILNRELHRHLRIQESIAHFIEHFSLWFCFCSHARVHCVYPSSIHICFKRDFFAATGMHNIMCACNACTHEQSMSFSVPWICKTSIERVIAPCFVILLLLAHTRLFEWIAHRTLTRIHSLQPTLAK